MFNKKIWSEFWDQFQLDVADVLQNNILNFSTLVALVNIWVEIYHPNYSKMVNTFSTSYLLVIGKQQIGTTNIKRD